MLFFTILIIEILIWAEVDVFVPSFPQIQSIFGISPFMVELTLGVNLLAQCIIGFFAGTLGDKYNKRIFIIGGIAVFLLGNLFCLFATSFWMLLFGRILQGIGVAFPNVMAYIVIADAYSLNEQKRMIGMVNGVITFAMAVAPVVGSYISLYYGWRGNFSFLLILAIGALILSHLYIPHDKKKHETQPSSSLKEYITVFRSKKTMLYVTALSLLGVPFFTFVAISPILYMEELGVSLAEFGFYQGILSVIFAVLSFTNGFFFDKFGERNCFIASIALMGIYVVCIIFLLIFEVRNPMIITAATIFMSAAAAFPIAILWPLCVDSMPSARAKVTALTHAARLIITTAAIQLTSYLYDGRYFYIGLVIMFAVFANFLALYKLNKYDKILS